MIIAALLADAERIMHEKSCAFMDCQVAVLLSGACAFIILYKMVDSEQTDLSHRSYFFHCTCRVIVAFRSTARTYPVGRNVPLHRTCALVIAFCSDAHVLST